VSFKLEGSSLTVYQIPNHLPSNTYKSQRMIVIYIRIPTSDSDFKNS